MARAVLTRRIASNPRKASRKGKSSMTAAKKKAFVARMKKARRASGNPSNKSKGNRKKTGRRNPSCRPNGRRRNSARRNPNILSDPKGLGINIVAALLSAVATRQLPQWVLGAKNTGWMGYVANVVSGAAATFAAHEFVNASAAQAAVLGSGVIVLDRVLTEQFSPVGKYLSLTGLGDATAATKLGEVAEGYYVHPTIFGPNGEPIIPHQITDAAVRAFASLQAQQPQPKMAGVRAGGNGQRAIAAHRPPNVPNRFAGRF
jgi:hypothetical protein